MRPFVLLALLAVSGCGWQAAGGSQPSPSVVVSVSIAAGQTQSIALPALAAGFTRSASSSAPAIVGARIGADGNLVVTGLAAGSALVVVTDRDASAAVITGRFDVTVTP